MKKNKLDLAAIASGRTWAIDRETAQRSKMRLAWILAATATLVAVVEAFALASLAPLKSVTPFTILVDRQTGHVETLDPLKPQHIKGDTALTQSMLAQFVTAREGYDIATIRSDYRKVSLWSIEGAQRDYLAMISPSNPEGPIATYGRSTIVSVAIRSVSPLSENTAMVRFDTLRSDAQGPLKYIGSWVAIMTYRYSGAPMAMEDRLINPLGFQVLSYRRDSEISRPPEEVDESSAPNSDRDSRANLRLREDGNLGSTSPLPRQKDIP